MPRLKQKIPSAAQLAARKAGAERLRAASEARKNVNTVRSTQPVRSTRGFIDTNEQKVGQDRTRSMKSTGPAREALEPGLVEPVENPVSKEKLDMLAFMEEELTILVHDSNDPTDEPFPEVINGGDRNRQYFIRGQEQQVKRKYVEVLARAKRTTRGNEKFKDANGDDAYRYPSHSALRYPFSVIHDPNPRGKDWLKSVLAS